MGMTTNTGGPAYPTSNYGAIVPISTGYSEGMTLRDYFAAKAINKCPLNSHSDAAQWCYAMADAMLKARELK
jgi:hypothetical protein